MKLPIFVYAQINKFTKEIDYDVWRCKCDVWDGTFVGEFTVDIPEVDRGEVLNGTIKSMRKSQQHIRAEAQAKVEQIEETIANLLCIEDRSAA